MPAIPLGVRASTWILGNAVQPVAPSLDVFPPSSKYRYRRHHQPLQVKNSYCTFLLLRPETWYHTWSKSFSKPYRIYLHIMTWILPFHKRSTAVPNQTTSISFRGYWNSFPPPNRGPCFNNFCDSKTQPGSLAMSVCGSEGWSELEVWPVDGIQTCGCDLWMASHWLSYTGSSCS